MQHTYCRLSSCEMTKHTVGNDLRSTSSQLSHLSPAH